MPDNPQRPYLSDAINYDVDIAPHQFVKIYAGVGSGKNTFIDNLAKGGIIKHADGSPVEKKYILLITSRRSKVNEQLNSDLVIYDPTIGMFDNSFSDWFAAYDERYADYFDSPTMTIVDPEGWGEQKIYKRTCVNTNAKIEYNLRQHFHPADAATHPWERFDMIVVDEAHSLLADASYQRSPFYVRRLIEETMKRSKTCKVIVMTGSPQILSRYPIFNDAHCVDMMDTCKNVVPQRIEFISKKDAVEKQLVMLKEEQHFVSFVNHIGDIFAIYQNKKIADHKNGIAYSFSDLVRRDNIKKQDPAGYERMCQAEEHLAKYQTLPDDIHAFYSTSKNKEGINIKNENFRTMFVEAHNELDVIQMAGRLRNPIQTLYVIVNSTPHTDSEDHNEKPFSKDTVVLDAINTHFRGLCHDNNIELDQPDCFRPVIHEVEPLGKFIEFIHNKFPYIRYDYFVDKFVYYEEREQSKEYYAEQRRIYDYASYTSSGLVALAHSWFPTVPCTVSVKPKGDMAEEIQKYLTDGHWLDGERPIRGEERTEILNELKRITGEPYKTLAPALKDWGYLLEVHGHKPSSLSTISVIPEGEK